MISSHIAILSVLVGLVYTAPSQAQDDTAETLEIGAAASAESSPNGEEAGDGEVALSAEVCQDRGRLVAKIRANKPEEGIRLMRDCSILFSKRVEALREETDDPLKLYDSFSNQLTFETRALTAFRQHFLSGGRFDRNVSLLEEELKALRKEYSSLKEKHSDEEIAEDLKELTRREEEFTAEQKKIAEINTIVNERLLKATEYRPLIAARLRLRGVGGAVDVLKTVVAAFETQLEEMTEILGTEQRTGD